MKKIKEDNLCLKDKCSKQEDELAFLRNKTNQLVSFNIFLTLMS